MTTTPHPNPTAEELVDAMLGRIAKLDPIDQRAAFFEELQRLPLHSRERRDFISLGRARFAGGYYDPREFAILSGVQAASETMTAEQLEVAAEHAAAYAALAEAREARFAALNEERAALGAIPRDRIDRTGNVVPGTPDVLSLRLREARELVRQAEEAFEEADRAEVRARPHQPRPLPPPPSRPAGLFTRILKAVSG